MVSANPDQDDYGDEEQEATPSLILQNRFKGLNLDERADILSKFTSQKVLYDEPLSSTQILLLKDAETDQDVIKKVILKEKLLNQDTYNYAKQEAAIHEMVSNHNNVVRLYDQKEDEKQFQMIMEYADKGDYFADKINERHTPIGNNQKLVAYAEDIL
jgi:serine/threonine protein kinase